MKTFYGGTDTSVKSVNVTPKEEAVDVHQASLPAATQTGNWSTSLQTVLDYPPSSLPYQVVIGGIIFGIAVVTWSMLGSMNEVGKATGRLVPQGESYKIHPVVLGKIARINVKEGQAVKAGQLIAQLDKEIAFNEVERLAQERIAYQTQLIQTQALIDKTRLEAKMRVTIANAEVQGQVATIAQVGAKIQSQKEAIAQGKERAHTSQKLLQQLYTDAAAQKERLQRLKSLVRQGALSQDQLFQAQQNFGDRQRSITQQTGDIQQVIADSQRSQADLQQVLAESQQMQAELAQKQATGKTVQLQAEQTIQKLQVEKTQLQAKVQQTEKLIQQAKTQLMQLSLTAPVDGMLLSLNVRNRGEVVQPGQAIAELAPNTAPLILEAVLPTQEAGFVKVGHKAQIKFDAYPYQNYGIVAGKVISISPDSKPDERLGTVYRVGIALDRNYVKSNHQIIRYQAGQTATAEIIIRRRRIADIILDPIRQLREGGINL
ncbi:HlyD family efflux transporter periplasmic adaptor subunit [Calothrix sp. PCC 7507]|uniref:HlyD family efflux transporter periplasmic adaptor subunit n=1 Tax=Calothrix sp. PCC 7507 TaxID=99598 RepID=UPI00029F1E3A|nr:HlyD family efflux transporter periplasmic adaptor subunit [Calothrix sp. PCC 7507]AFY32655.1 secretion protein HlyD family protein [Calothrix sp. PCC 7507]